MQGIERLAQDLLSKEWQGLDRETLRGHRDWAQPGVYALAYSDELTVKQPLNDLRRVFYVGMSRAVGGVKSRLSQFVEGIEKNAHHSGAMRFFREHAGGIPFSALQGGKRFFVVVLTIPCQVKPEVRTPFDLRQIGHITCLEYYVRALIKEQTGGDPELNKQ